QFFQPAQENKPIQTPPPVQMSTKNDHQDYVDKLIQKNFSDISLKNLFDKKESFLNKILFDTQDSRGVYLFQSIIANQTLFDVFYSFISKNKNTLGKISA